MTRSPAAPARRRHLLTCSALCGVAALLATPVVAQTLPGIPTAGNITVSAGGSQPVVTAPNGNTLEIDLNAPRTVINWASLHVSGADAMNFHFDAGSDIVLNKTTTQIAIDAGGTVTGKVGAATGGNIWFYSPQGVIVSPGAVMTAGGFLFSRGSSISDTTFVNAGDPLAALRAAADSLIRIDTITSATNVSISASGDVVLSAATGNLNAAIVAGAGSATVTATVGTVSVTEVTATGGVAQVTAGGAGATVITLTGATGASVTSAGNTSVNSATTTTSGDVTISGGTTATAGTVTSSRDVAVTALDGAADVASAQAGDDITVSAVGGDAILRTASLTGSGASHDLSVSALLGDAVLGEPDYLDITVANVFNRAAGNTGSATVTSTGGDALVHLETTTHLDTLQGQGVDVTVNDGDVSIATVTALTNDIYLEVLNGPLALDSASAIGGYAELYVAGGDLTITGSLYGGLGVHAETDGLLDGTLATSISTGGDLELFGGDVDLDSISADGELAVGATTGDAVVQFAQAGGTAQVISLAGDATLRGAEAPDGIAVVADQTATFGADSLAAVTTANYAITDPGCGCGPGAGGLTVLSFSGDARANLDNVTGDIALVAAAIDGDVSVGLKTGDLKIDELAGFNIALEASAGTLETGFTTSSGGDYSLTAQGFLGDALAPTLFSDPPRDVTIIDTLGDLDLTGIALHANRTLTVTAQNGAVTGDGQLSAGSGLGDGDISVEASAITLDTVAADGDVTLDATAGAVTVTTGVSVDGDYRLTGEDFSTAALAPTGAKAGTWYITKTLGDFDYSALDMDLNFSAVGISASFGAVTGGDITAVDGIYIEGAAVTTGALSAEDGYVVVRAYTGGASIGSARAEDRIDIYGDDGATLGAAVLLGAGHNTLDLSAIGDVTLGAATPGAITAANVFTSASTDLVATIVSSTGAADINLKSSAALNTVTGFDGVGIEVSDGALELGAIYSASGSSLVRGPSGALTIDAVSGGGDAQVIGGGDTRIRTASLAGDLDISSATGDVLLNAAFGDFDIDGTLSLDAHGGVVQGPDMVIGANTLNVKAGTGASLLGSGNAVQHLGVVQVAAGGFALNSGGAFDLTGAITATGQTVDLRSGGAITQQAAGVITAQRLIGGSVGGASFGAANQVAELGAFTNTGGALLFNDARSLTLTGTVLSTGQLTVRSHGGLTIAATGTAQANAAGDAVVLASDGVFTNASGTDGVVAGNVAGRWLIYSQVQGDPSAPTTGNGLGGLAGKSFYGAAYDFTAGTFATAPNAGNRFVYGYQPTLTATPVTQTVTYDGAIPTVSATLSGLVNGDAAADAWSGQAGVSGATSQNAGGYTLTATLGTLASDMNYRFAFGTGLLTIDPKALTGLLQANDKTYDGGVAATGSVQLSGVVAGDSITAAGAYAFGDKNAGTGKAVTATGVTLGGTGAANYTLASVGADTADITAKTITGALTANDKTYDGTTAATGTVALAGVVAGDDLSATGASYAFADKNAGAGKTVTASGVGLGGADSGNYILSTVSTDTADIGRKAIAGLLTADDKTYDGATAAAGSLALTGVVSGDDLSVSGAGLAFADKNAGVGKTVTATGAVLGGADAANYDLAPTATATADIARKAIGGVLTANDKVYDGTTAATGSLSLTGVVSGDDLSVASTGLAFADKNAGAGKTVTATGVSLSGADSGNYLLSTVSADTADIARKTISGTTTADNKTYDGATTATGSATLGGVVVGDQVSASATHTFADANAGVGKTVTAQNAALTGADAGNYQLSGLGAAQADILRRAVTVAADNGVRPQGQPDPALTYRLAVGSLVTGDGFTGALARAAGEAPGDYAIGRGTLALSANYDVTFTGAVFTIRPPPTGGQDGTSALRNLGEAVGFDLDWDPSPNLNTNALGCLADGSCPPQADLSAEGPAPAPAP